MSPAAEELQGRRRTHRNLVARLILHKLLAGRPAFEATTVGAHFAMILSEPPTRLRAHVPSAPAELERAILMCLMRDRAERWQDLGQLAAALAPFGPPRSEQRAERVARILRQSGAESVSHPELLTVEHAPTIRQGPVREPADGLLTDGNAPTSTWSPVAREVSTASGRRLVALGAVAVVIAGARAVVSCRTTRPGGNQPEQLEPRRLNFEGRPAPGVSGARNCARQGPAAGEVATDA